MGESSENGAVCSGAKKSWLPQARPQARDIEGVRLLLRSQSAPAGALEVASFVSLRSQGPRTRSIEEASFFDSESNAPGGGAVYLNTKKTCFPEKNSFFCSDVFSDVEVSFSSSSFHRSLSPN